MKSLSRVHRIFYRYYTKLFVDIYTISKKETSANKQHPSYLHTTKYSCHQANKYNQKQITQEIEKPGLKRTGDKILTTDRD